MTRTALITGASRGIGLATAMQLARPGGQFGCLVLVARSSDHFSASVARVQDVNPDVRVVAIEADLSEPARVPEIYDRLDAEGVQVDTIINNAGFTKPASVLEAKLSEFEYTMRVNLLSPFALVQEALHRSYPLTRIINIASTAGVNGRAGWLTYSASKAALINMSEVLRHELGPYDIDVVCLSPGRCATELRRVLAPDEDPDSIMQPEQLAEVVEIVASDTGKLLLNQNLVVRL